MTVSMGGGGGGYFYPILIDDGTKFIGPFSVEFSGF